MPADLAFREWFGARELAGVPGMPTTPFRVRCVLERVGAVKRKTLRGKGYLYSRQSLPAQTQLHLAALEQAAMQRRLEEVKAQAQGPAATPAEARVTTPAATPPAPAEVTALEPQPPRPPTAEQREREFARLYVLRAVREIERSLGCRTAAAARVLLERARRGELSPAQCRQLERAADDRGGRPEERRAAGQGALPSSRSIQRWATRHAKWQALAPAPKRELDLRVRGWYRHFFAYADRPQKPTLRQAHEQLLATWNPDWADTPGGPPPSYDAAVRAYAKRSRLDVIRGRHTGSALRARTFYRHRTYAGMEPFTEVHADGWTTHFTAPHPTTGEFVTYEVWHYHDVATRYVTPVAVGLTENPDVVLEGLRRCIAVGGVMAIWQTDHTRSAKNAAVQEEHTGLADRLGITLVHPVAVGNSNANGIAENFNTFLDRESRALATYQHPQRMDSGTFVRVRKITNAMVRAADRPEERARLRQRAMRMGKGLVLDTHAQALDWLNACVAKWNAHPHRALPKARCEATGRLVHMSPQQSLAAAAAAGWRPVLLSEAVLEEEFRPHLRKKVVRGTVTPYGGMRYLAPELAHHEGEEVLVVVDRERPATVVVKDVQGRVIATALFVEAVGPRSESMAEHTQRKRAEAQVRLRERQIEQIEARIAPAAIEMDAGHALVAPMVVPSPARAPVAEPLRRAPLVERAAPAGPPQRLAPAVARPAAAEGGAERRLTYLESMERLRALERQVAAARAAAAEAASTAANHDSMGTEASGGGEASAPVEEPAAMAPG
jgi:putative transposase